MQNPMPLFARSMGALSAIFAKGEAHCASAKIDPAVLMGARLFPDMLPFSRQVMIVTDNAKACAARLTGTETPRYEDVETTFAELRARIARTVDYIGSFKDADFAGAEDRAIAFKAGPRELSFTGASYLQVWAIPNFFFHVTTAYNILRHNGVPLGKADYLGG